MIHKRADLQQRHVWRRARQAREQAGQRLAPDGPRRSKGQWLGLLKWGIHLLGLKGRGLRNALDVRLSRLDFEFGDLPPAFDGFTILQISDPHLDELPQLVDRAKALVAGLRPDLLIVTGDIRGKVHGRFDHAIDLLHEIVGGIEGCPERLAILGNHDATDMVEALETVGFQVLINETIELIHRGSRVFVTGLDDVHTFYTDAAANALVTDADGFRILLVHSAEMADHAAAAGYDLYLCGHTHGGQICLPGGRELLSTLTRCKEFSRGTWACGAMTGYTNSGLGVSGVPARFNCPGEISMITLRRKLAAVQAASMARPISGSRVGRDSNPAMLIECSG